MALLDFPRRTVLAKVVYFGAPGAGAAQSVRSLYGLLPSRERTRLHSLHVLDAPDPTALFEYVPSGAMIPGFTLRVRVYSLVAGIKHHVHRKEVMKHVDGTMLVVDARSSAEPPDAAVTELSRAMRDDNLDPARLPAAVHISYSDTPDARSKDTIAGLLSGTAWARAVPGTNLVEQHERLVADIARRVRDNLAGDLHSIGLGEMPTDAPQHEDDLVARHQALIDFGESHSRPSLVLAVADVQQALRARYAALTPGPKIEVGFQPREFAGTRIVHVMDARIEGNTAVVDIVTERMNGGEPRRLSIAMINRPPDATVPVKTAPAPAPREPPRDIPEKIELPAPEPVDFPPVWYGVAGLAAGVVVGALIAVIVLM